MRILLFLFTGLCVFIPEVSSQSYAVDNWWQGHVILKDSSQLDGWINYDYESNSLILKQGMTQRTYVAHDVMMFKIYEVRKEGELVFMSRDYYPIYQQNQYGFSMPSFYNVILSGHVSVLLKSRDDHPNYFFMRGGYFYGDEIYLMFENGTVVKASERKRKLVSQLGGNKKELLEFIKRYGLNLRYPYDVQRLVSFYNDKDDL